MKILFFLIVSAVIPINVVAQTKTDAKDIVEKTSQLYREWGGMEIAFVANISSVKNGTSESFEGTITMKGDKFVLKTPDMTTWFDGKTQWTYITRNNEVNVIEPSDKDLRFLNPMFLINDYKKDFNVSLIGESTSGNAKTAYDILLVPKKNDDFEKIEVQIEKSTFLPARLVATMRNDMRSSITIRQINRSNEADAVFLYPKEQYPDAEIIDLR
ncbi:MAG: outer membrane lipoprotein-sorting protein [Tannerella sp.]|jgi:outer membrane lipoprotein-sorting protein|nr:outer membrane lipoprotein-sorting protein [Tannerella sp.]